MRKSQFEFAKDELKYKFDIKKYAICNEFTASSWVNAISHRGALFHRIQKDEKLDQVLRITEHLMKNPGYRALKKPLLVVQTMDSRMMSEYDQGVELSKQIIKSFSIEITNFTLYKPVLVSMQAPDSVILESFKNWLVEQRLSDGNDTSRRKIRSDTLKEWSRLRLLAFLDLLNFLCCKKIYLHKEEICDLLYIDDAELHASGITHYNTIERHLKELQHKGNPTYY